MVDGEVVTQQEMIPVPNRPMVCCIVVNWNGWRDTVVCLESLRGCEGVLMEVLVVDNGSTDDSVFRIRTAHPWAEVLETKANLGFAGGNNEGMRAALSRGAKYVWLLNNDTKVEPDTLQSLVACAEADPRRGEVGSVLRYMHAPERIQAWGGGRVNLWTGRSRHCLTPVDTEKLSYLTAASVLLPCRVLREVGMLDDGYFMYWEDTDLSFRIRAAGWSLAVAAEAIVYHKESASSVGRSPQLDRYMIASGIRFMRKFSPWPWLSIGMMVFGRAGKRFLMLDWARGRAVLAGLSGIGKAKSGILQPAESNSQKG